MIFALVFLILPLKPLSHFLVTLFNQQQNTYNLFCHSNAFPKNPPLELGDSWLIGHPIKSHAAEERFKVEVGFIHFN